MSQRCRFDEPGVWLHASNRGVARRDVHSSRHDRRFFLSCLARAIRAGWFELHAFSLLSNHFHLLIRSTCGTAWRGLRRAQCAHARHFNVRHGRDGPLFRGRFRSKRIDDATYWNTVVRYIDFNPVRAGLVAYPEEWEFGSAAVYLGLRPAPRWLTTSGVEAELGSRSPDAYRRRFGDPLGPVPTAIVERRLIAPDQHEDPVGVLVGAPPERIAQWLRRRAILAAGSARPALVVSAETLNHVADRSTDRDAAPTDASSLLVLPREQRVVRSGLLRHCAGASYREIGLRLGCSTATAHDWVRVFDRRIVADDATLLDAANLAAAAIDIDWGPSGGDRDR